MNFKMLIELSSIAANVLNLPAGKDYKHTSRFGRRRRPTLKPGDRAGGETPGSKAMRFAP